MNRLTRLMLGLAVTAVPVIGAAQHQHDMTEMTVIGTSTQKQRVTVDPMTTPLTGPAVGDLLKRSPGANVNFNGPLSGIGQYRGMFAYRLRTDINSVPLTSGGPNWMDSPLHYAPMPLLKTVEVQRGVTPVSFGAETIGGYMAAETVSSEFGFGDSYEFGGSIHASGQTVDNGYGLGTMLSLANDTNRFHLSGSYEKGDDTEFPDGDIVPTEYERKYGSVGYGFTTGNHTFGVDYFRNETEDTGTPALPMDIEFIDTDAVSFDYQGKVGDIALEGLVYYNRVDHGMNNFSLRAEPPGPMFRRNIADSESLGFEFSGTTDIAGGVLKAGLDAEQVEHNSDISNPNNAAFFVRNFNDVKRDRYSLFAEWNNAINEDWSYQVGGRYTQVETDAGDVGSNGPPDPGLAAAFNAADRELDWGMIDAVATLTYKVSETLSFDATVAHKERAPAYQELYLWLPLQATAGLADGNNYIGNLDLKEEKANIIELGLRWNYRASYINPKVFYQRVDDYIQGTETTNQDAIDFCDDVAMCMNLLEFTNVDAELYGVDTDFGAQFSEHLRMDGVISYVRGKRRDISDDLYRIAPLSSIIGVSYGREVWRATLEGVFAMQQDNVSETNGETKSAGYGYMNLYGTYEVTENLMLTVGVNNVFDKEYRDHTGGVNRANGSDVAVGERLPGPGQSFFARAHYNW